LLRYKGAGGVLLEFLPYQNNCVVRIPS
jgi:hypothetical protein